MKTFAKLILILVVVAGVAAIAQPPQDLLTEKRLTVHTLLREDLFAGFMKNDMERFARGEKNLEALLKLRPENRAELLAWKGGSQVYRAVLDLEAGKPAAYDEKMKTAMSLFEEAKTLQPRNGGVMAPMGGSLVFFGDRVADKDKARAWELAYQSFSMLWKAQEATVSNFPLHIKGELLAGLAQSAQRTGRKQELSQYLDKIAETMPGSSYDKIAQRWKKNPGSAADSSMICLTCHEAGRLEARLATFPKSGTN